MVVLEEEEQRQREEEAKNAFMSEEQSAGTVIPGANPEGMSLNITFWDLSDISVKFFVSLLFLGHIIFKLLKS